MSDPDANLPDKKLFWACFVALVATSFVFSVRSMVIGDWQTEFNLSETQKGQILGAGLWPFAITIVVFSLIIDKIGYKTAAFFAIFCQIASTIIIIFANGYWALWIGSFVVALGNGTVEAYINPVVATMYKKEKTKWLNILHAGWPLGLVIGGLVAIFLKDQSWQLKMGLLLVPVIFYTILTLPCKFPVNERVAAGVPYRDMLKEVGVLGFLIIGYLLFNEIGRVFDLPIAVVWSLIAITVIGVGIYTKSPGAPIFLILLITIGPLATTELGTDTWITELMEPEMTKLGVNAGWVLIYTSLIMTVLRFCAGPIVHKLSPLGLLMASAALAICGLIFLSKAVGITILLAATLYGFGKTFLWPTTLGIVAERFPKGGALTLNGVSAVGVLFMGIIGAPLIGLVQDQSVDADLLAKQPEIHAKVVGEPEKAILGLEAPTIDGEKLAAASEEEQAAVTEIQEAQKKATLARIAVLPVFMLICYVGLFLYFKSRGGYKPVDLAVDSP
ncbi:MAG: MFS transporter [Verrucomicrobiota bacterium]